MRCGGDVSEVFHYARGPAPFGDQVSHIAPDHLGYDSYATFSDPDGNSWLLRKVTTRFPGRVAGDATTYASIHDLAQAPNCRPEEVGLRACPVRARLRQFGKASLSRSKSEAVYAHRY